TTSQSSRSVCAPNAKSSSIARILRPIRRCISCVRPPSCPRSRGTRVRVARGSIAYSAVIQPRPLPLRQPGTPSSTVAAQRTRVSPNDTRHEPSAYGTTPRSMAMGRSALAARWFGLSATDAVDDGRRGLSLNERNHFDIPTSRTNFPCAHDRLLAIIAAFDQDIRLQGRDDRERGVFVKDHHGVGGL